MPRVIIQKANAKVISIVVKQNMTANSLDWDQPLAWYSGFINVLKWNNLGIVLGTGKTKEAQLLGASII